MSTGSFIPKQRLPEDCGAEALDFRLKTNAQTTQTLFVIPGGCLGVGKSIWKKLKNSSSHCFGAILHNREKTSDAGTV